MDVFTIGMTAKMTGLTEFTLRAWERRYGIAKPRRSDSGRRVYTLKEIEKLKLFKLLTDQGHSIGEIADLDMSKLKLLLKQERRVSGVTGATVQIMAAIRECNLPKLALHLKSAQMERDMRSFLIDVISPVLSELGEAVTSGQLDVYHEHAASALIRNLLSGLLYSLEKLPNSETLRPIVFATPEGDHHEFGILISAILAALRGERVFYLGPNMPAGSLARAVKNLDAAVIVLGCSAPREALSALDWREFVNELSKTVDLVVPFWLGGFRTSEVKNLSSLKKRSVVVMNDYRDLENSLQRLRQA